MRFSTLPIILLPALAVASQEPELVPPPPLPAIPQVSATATFTTSFVPATAAPQSDPQPTQSEQRLELREEDATADVTTAATQANPATTQWVASNLADGGTTYVEVIWSQTFASVVDQWATAGSGSIGLGTITGTTGVVKTSEADKSNGSERSRRLGRGLVVAAVGVAGLVCGANLL